jgi:hypothetical protein
MLDNTEGVIKQGQSREMKENKTKTQYALDTTICKQTQITLIRHRGKDGPNIVFMRKS